MKKISILLLLLCLQSGAWAQQITIGVGANCKLSSNHPQSFDWDFKSELALQTSGAKDNFKQVSPGSLIEIIYDDNSTAELKFADILKGKNKFEKIKDNPYQYKLSLADTLSKRDHEKKIRLVKLKVKCGQNTKEFTIRKAIVDRKPEKEEKVSIVPTISGKKDDSCNNQRLLTFNKNCSAISWFGEEACYYTEHHKTYIYDFNKDIAKRGFFKVYKKADQTLIVEPVNFTREYLRPRDVVHFKVVHINRFMYDVSIADTLVQFDSEPSPLFNRFFLGDSNLLANLTSAFAKGISGDAGESDFDGDSQKEGLGEGDNEEDSMQTLMHKIGRFIQKYNGLQAKMLQAYNPCSEFPCCAAEDYHALANDLLEIKLLSAQDEPFFNKTLKELNEQKKKRDNHKVKSAELETVQKQLTDVKKKKADDLTAAEKTLLSRETALTKEIMTGDELKTLEEQIAANEKLLEPYESLQSLNESLPKISEIRQMILFLNNMVEQNQTYMTEITSLRGNMLDVTLNIAAKDSMGRIAPAYSNFSLVRRIELPIVGRLFPSFSSGSFIGFSKSLKNKTYEWRKLPDQNNLVTDTATYELSESGYSLPPMGIAALVNAEIKIIPDLGLGLSAGVGLTLESKPRVAYLAGGSLFLGNKRQLALTCGIMAVQVEQLSNNLNVGQYTYTATGRPSISYYKELKAGGFLALSYTPFIQRPAHKR